MCRRGPRPTHSRPPCAQGLELTSPVVAAGMQPAVPVLTSLLAVALGSERISFRRRDGWAKLYGAGLVVAGAMVTARREGGLVGGVGSEAQEEERRRALGMACLLANCTCMAAYLTLQESLLQRYARPMRITLLSYAFGAAMLVAALALGAGGAETEHRWTLPAHARVAVVYAGVVASGVNYVLLAWGNQQLGPALVSLYLPLQPLAAAILSTLAFGTPMGSGVLLGGGLIAGGLGCVAWGRGAGRRYEERQEEKAVYFARLGAAGGGEEGKRSMVRTASARLLSAASGGSSAGEEEAPEAREGGKEEDSRV